MMGIVLVLSSGSVFAVDTPKDQNEIHYSLGDVLAVDAAIETKVPSLADLESSFANAVHKAKDKQFAPTGLILQGHINPKPGERSNAYENKISSYKPLKYVINYKDRISWFYLYHRKL